MGAALDEKADLAFYGDPTAPDEILRQGKRADTTGAEILRKALAPASTERNPHP